MSHPAPISVSLPFVWRGRRLFAVPLRLAVCEAQLPAVLDGAARQLSEQAMPAGIDGLLLRDVVDVDAMCRHYAANDPDFWGKLVRRAGLHGALRPVAYAIEFARGWFDTPVGDAFDAAWNRERRRGGTGWVIDRAQRSLPPPDPDRGPDPASRRAARWMLARSVWLRMPPWLLAYHAAMKGWRNATGREMRAARAGG